MPFDLKTGLYYENYGRSDAPALVFLHGGGVAGWMWRHQVEYFKESYYCLVPDLPEQGRSEMVRPFSIPLAADGITDLIRSQARGGKANVVGLSEGAQVAVQMLNRHAEVIDHAVCSSAMLLPMPGQWMYSRGMFRTACRWFVTPLKNNDRWIRLNMRYSAGAPDEYYEEFKRSFQAITESGFVNLMYESTHFRLPPGLDKADVPVLVTAGRREYRQMIQSCRDLLAVLPQAKGALVSLGRNSSLSREHNWAMTAPDLFNETVSAWIEERRLPEELLPLE
jgi:pimeloyl-ACP methyl ester carboxylesterase